MTLQPPSTLARCLGLGLLLALPVWPDDDAPARASLQEKTAPGGAKIVQSKPGDNAWNAGQPVGDWWAEIKRQHGHVGPWNVLGWRIGQAALREFKSEWGRHELEVVCYVPPQTPFTCLADGLSVGTGNSLGRLDLRLVEVLDYRQSFVAVRRKDLKGDVVELRPESGYLRSIMGQPVEKLDDLSRECARRSESELFGIRRFAP